MPVGRIKQCDWGKGLGYIELPDGRQVRVLGDDMPKWGRGFRVGDVVEFKLVGGLQGLQAKQVKRASAEAWPGDTMGDFQVTSSPKATLVPSTIQPDRPSARPKPGKTSPRPGGKAQAFDDVAGDSRAVSHSKTASVSSVTKPTQPSARRQPGKTSPRPDGKVQARNDYSQALAARKNREYDRARQLFEKAIAGSPDRAFFDAYAGMEKDLGQLDLARRIYERAIEHFPEAGNFYESYVLLARREGRMQEAADVLRKGLERVQDHEAIHRRLAQLVEEIEDNSRRQQAQQDYSQALVARQNREHDRARQLFEKAIAHSPERTFFDAYAKMEKELRQFDRARRIYERALEHFPEAGSFYEAYGMLARREGRLQDAADIFRQGLNCAPKHRVLHRWLAQVLMEMGDDSLLEEAEGHFEAARRLGVPPDDVLYQKLKVLRSHSRAPLTLRFLEQAGFEATWFHLQGQGFAGDMVFQPRRAEYQEAYDLYGEVFVRCFYLDEVSYQNIDWTIGRVRTADVKRPLNRDVLFVVLKSVAHLRDALYRLQEPRREEQPNPTVVPLEEGELQQGLEAGDSEGTLRQVLDQWLYRRDLYNDKSPVSGRRFFGREEELATLARNVDSGQHTGVFGLRRVGKTSLLHQLREKRSRDLSAYVNIQAAPAGVRDCTWLYWSAANEWRNQLEAKYPNLADGLSFRLAGCYRSYADLPEPTQVAVAFDSDLRLLCETLAHDEETSQVKALLLLDEIDEILPRQEQIGWAGYVDFLAYLRGMAQQTGFLVSAVTAANPRLCEEPQFERLDNPVFQFYQEMYLPPLERHECFEMVEKLGKGMGLTYDPTALQRIYDETGGHPSIARRLCSRLAARFPERPLAVEEAMVEVAAEEFLFHDESIFREILERLDRNFPTEKELLLAIARGTTDSAELSALAPTGLEEALRHLVGYQLVSRTEDGAYRVKIRLLDRWLRRRWLGLED